MNSNPYPYAFHAINHTTGEVLQVENRTNESALRQLLQKNGLVQIWLLEGHKVEIKSGKF